MNTMLVTKATDLAAAWKEVRERNPHLRIRDAAEVLGVSEAELLATGCGESVVRLGPDFPSILQELHRLGRVMALTRNDEIVHERKGLYKNVEAVSGHANMGLAVNEDIDLRIFFNRWHFAFASTAENARGPLRSFQFFDSDGTAVHKVFLTDASDGAEFENITAQFASSDQTPHVDVQPKPAADQGKPDEEIAVDDFRKAWESLKDTHDFFPMLRKFDVGRHQALRLADKRMATQIAPDGYKHVLNKASAEKIAIMVFVGNPGIIQIHTGLVENVVEARGWFNVLDENFNLHIDQSKIAETWVVYKPTDDGMVTSVELFNAAGENVALLFGKRKPGIPESENWRALVANLLVECPLGR